MKEFQVVATGASAEFGRTAGGVINVITKSGTNDVHGNAFYFQRLEALTGILQTVSRSQDFHREQYGGRSADRSEKTRRSISWPLKAFSKT